jgi:hypothetical protein
VGLFGTSLFYSYLRVGCPTILVVTFFGNCPPLFFHKLNALSSHQWLQNWQISALHLSKTELLKKSAREKSTLAQKATASVGQQGYK